MLEAQFLATISYYVSELRPVVNLDVLKQHATLLKEHSAILSEQRPSRERASRQSTEISGGEESFDWTFVRRRCFEGDVAAECANGGNYVKALRVLREAEMEYGFKDGLYLNTALMIVEQMIGVMGD